MATMKKDGRTSCKAGPAAKAAHLLSDELHAEIEGLTKLTLKTIGSEGEENQIPVEKLDRAVDVLTLSRALVRATETAYKAAVEPLEKQIRPYTAEKKAIVARAIVLSGEIEKGLYGLIQRGELRSDGHESKSGCRLTLVRADGSPEVKDVRRVPKHYLLPPEVRVDMKAVSEAYAAAKKRGDEDFAIPGIELAEPTYTFRTKQPDYVEN